jgi:hypothetical protein
MRPKSKSRSRLTPKVARFSRNDETESEPLSAAPASRKASPVKNTRLLTEYACGCIRAGDSAQPPGTTEPVAAATVSPRRDPRCLNRRRRLRRYPARRPEQRVVRITGRESGHPGQSWRACLLYRQIDAFLPTSRGPGSVGIEHGRFRPRRAGHHNVYRRMQRRGHTRNCRVLPSRRRSLFSGCAKVVGSGGNWRQLFEESAAAWPERCAGVLERTRFDGKERFLRGVDLFVSEPQSLLIREICPYGAAPINACRTTPRNPIPIPAS